MTFRDFLIHGFVGYYRNEHLAGTAFAIVTGVALVLCMLTYFIGSLNFSIIISKYLYQDDVRNYGSGNAGTTNMLRTYGRRAAVLTLVGDALKAVISSLFGYALMGFTGAYIAGFFCILGHVFPIYYRFRGGKGIVTAAFMMLMLDPRVFAILFAVFIILVAASKMVSFGSVICILLYPFLLYRMSGPGTPIIFAMLITVLVIFMHRENIMRIYRGEESKVDFGKLFGRKKKDGEVAEEQPIPADGEPIDGENGDDTDDSNTTDETDEPTAKKPHAISEDKKKRQKKQREQQRRAGNGK